MNLNMLVDGWSIEYERAARDIVTTTSFCFQAQTGDKYLSYGLVLGDNWFLWTFMQPMEIPGLSEIKFGDIQIGQPAKVSSNSFGTRDKYITLQQIL